MKKLLFVLLMFLSLSLLSCQKIEEDFEQKPKVEIVKTNVWEFTRTIITSTNIYVEGFPLTQKNTFIIDKNYTIEQANQVVRTYTYKAEQTNYVFGYGNVDFTIVSTCTKKLIENNKK